ncbi:uncharacterized protein [Malus domestica]|uniref:uncharacterized protein n=1 Tax=Malus domestica TaxID=3750 RepID=UPI0039756DEB
MVNELIDKDLKAWNKDLIIAGFNCDDVVPILSILISRMRCYDRMVWHHTTNGVYTVRYGYGVAWSLLENGGLGRKGRGATSGVSKRTRVWNRIWNLEVPNKMKYFVWRCCNSALAVRPNLQRRHMRVDNVFTFLEVGRISVIGFEPLEVVKVWKHNIVQFRGTRAHEGVERSPRMGNVAIESVPRRVQWKPPLFGTLRVNFDAAWCKDLLRAGVGLVVYDFVRLLQAAGGSGELFCHFAAAAEAVAVRDALEFCYMQGFDQLVVESDARVIIQMLRKEMQPDFSLECILGDIESLVQRMRSVTFAIVPRKGNGAAHLVAKFVFQEKKTFLWDCIGPEFLFNILAQDINLSIRL